MVASVKKSNRFTPATVRILAAASALALSAMLSLAAAPSALAEQVEQGFAQRTASEHGSFEIGAKQARQVDAEGFAIESDDEPHGTELVLTTQASDLLRTSSFPSVAQAEARYQELVLAGVVRCDAEIDISSCGFYADATSNYGPSYDIELRLEDLFSEMIDEDLHPELFCTSGYARVEYEMDDRVRAGEKPLAADKHRFRFTSVVPSYEGRDIWSTITAAQAKVQRDQFDSKTRQILAGAPVTGSEAAKAKYVHDWLLANVSFSFVKAGKDYYPASAFGAIVDGKASCMGYSRANKYLLGKLGIESVCVSNTPPGVTGHEWNRVKINGAWYHEDVTWDDPASHDYFLRSDKWWKKEGVRNGNLHVKWQPTGVAGTSTAYDGNVKWPVYVKTSIAGGSVYLDTAKVRYNGKYRLAEVTDVIEPVDGMALEEGVDFTVSYKKAKLGRAYATVTGKGYFCGKIKTSLKIEKRDISTVYTAKYKLAKRKFTGHAIEPVKAKTIGTFDEISYDYGTYKLKEGVDYTVKYKRNVKPGTAIAIIKGKGGFKGRVVKTFKIVGHKAKKGTGSAKGKAAGSNTAKMKAAGSKTVNVKKNLRAA